ncbi:MAG TPA: tetratricopeptide repeat protein [Elusimicrobiota bacterium]|jgi:TolA-binding protein|nr:tetratricopeptide repeat protein [Elusimicrobiota bacterium]
MTMKDTKHWATKSEAAKDEVRDFVEEAVDWVIVHRREAGWTALGVAAAGLILGLFLYGRNQRIDAAWDKLSQAELYAYSGRVPEAQTRLGQVVDEGGAPAATTLAYMLQGDLNYPHAAYDQALSDYDKASQAATDPLRPYSQADKVMTLEAAGKYADCAAAAQSFLDATPDQLMAPQVYVELARCQAAQGQNDAAKATLQRIALQYPNTPWSEWASARLQTLPK